MRAPSLRLLGLLAVGLCACLGLQGISIGADAVPPTGAQKPPERPVPVSGIIDRNHQLGPGDTIDITLEGFPEFSRSVRLFADGSFDYPRIGTVQATGMTTRDLEQKLTELFLRELRRPRVTVQIRDIYIPPKVAVEARKTIITALGLVTNPGEREFPGPTPLRKVLFAIGPQPNADLSRILIKYPDGRQRSADFSKFTATGMSSDDITIIGGEEITLIEKPALARQDPIRFTIVGEGTSKPGAVSSDGSISLLDALEKVGGPRAGADLERVEVIGPKHPEMKLVNVDDYATGNIKANYLCQDGDYITVKLKPNRILVVGEVSKQGYLNVRDGETLMSVLLQVQVVGSGEPTRTQIIRRGSDAKPVYTTVNFRDIQKQKAPDVPVRRDDVIFVPKKRQGPRGVLGVLGQIVAPLWLVRSVAPVP